jgi:DNA-binding SARP family transcriptional activator
MSVARRKRKRHLTRLRELAEEFGIKPPPVLDDLTIARPVAPEPKEPPEPVAIAADPTHLSLSERLARLRAADAKITPV